VADGQRELERAAQKPVELPMRERIGLALQWLPELTGQTAGYYAVRVVDAMRARHGRDPTRAEVRAILRRIEREYRLDAGALVGETPDHANTPGPARRPDPGAAGT
jgi:hypothetical protein